MNVFTILTTMTIYIAYYNNMIVQQQETISTYFVDFSIPLGVGDFLSGYVQGGGVLGAVFLGVGGNVQQYGTGGREQLIVHLHGE